MITEYIDELRELILREVENREPRVLDASVNIVVDDETGDESTAVDLTLADPPSGSEMWDLRLLDDLAMTVERIVAEQDLPSAVLTVTPVTREEFEDDPAFG